MTTREAARVALPALGVHGATEHDRLVAGDVVHLGGGDRLRVTPCVAHGGRDALGDLRSRGVLARIGDQDGRLGHVAQPATAAGTPAGTSATGTMTSAASSTRRLA